MGKFGYGSKGSNSWLGGTTGSVIGGTAGSALAGPEGAALGVVLPPAIGYGAQHGAIASTKGAAESARAIVKAANLRGGLIVHVECGDGRMTASLAAPSAGETSARPALSSQPS